MSMSYIRESALEHSNSLAVSQTPLSSFFLVEKVIKSVGGR